MNVEQAIEVFAKDWSMERTLAWGTTRAYKTTLRGILRSTFKWPFEALENEAMKTLLAQRRGKVTPRTYQQDITTLRLFSRWATAEGHWPRDFLAKYAIPTVRRRLPTFLDSPEEVLEMASLLNPLSIHDMRDRAMLLVSYSGALRPQEMFNLRVGDYLPSYTPPALHIRTLKRGQPRYVMLIPIAHQALEEYLALARDLILAGRRDPKWLFPANGGGQMGQTYWLSHLKALGKAAGIPKNITPHVLRHSVATHLARGGMSPWKLQSYLGHSDLNSTGIYVHMLDKDVIEGLEDAMPLFHRRR